MLIAQFLVPGKINKTDLALFHPSHTLKNIYADAEMGTTGNLIFLRFAYFSFLQPFDQDVDGILEAL